MKIVIDKNIPFIQGVLEKYAEVVYLPGIVISREDLLDVDALIIRTRTKCNKELLQGTSVKFIASATIGYDHIDVNYLSSQNIKWTNCAGCNAFSVQQYLASSLLVLANLHNIDLSKKTIGIIGCGHVGSKVKKIAEIFGMQVLVNDPPRKNKESIDSFVDLDAIQKADFITIHTPLSRKGKYKTHHLVDEEFLNKTNRDAFIINTARGEIVNSEDLKIALQTNRTKGAVLDVWENEPLVDKELANLVDIATPHIAGYAVDGKSTATKMIIHSLSSFFNLPLQNWQAKNLPKIKLNFTGLSLKEKILATYNVLNDDILFRKSYDSFEELRQNYNIRRDFSYFKSILRHDRNF